MSVAPFWTPADLADFDAFYLSALTDTATITNPVPPEGTPVPFTAACAVLKPTRNTRTGAAITPVGKRVDWTLAMPRDTHVLTGAAITVVENNRGPAGKTRYLKAGEIVRNAGNDPAIFVETVEVPGP